MHTLYVQARPRHSLSRDMVQLSLPLLSSLFHLKQPLAADSLGISLTSLKTACRRLGLRRWPYERDREQERETRLGPGTPAEEDDCSADVKLAVTADTQAGQQPPPSASEAQDSQTAPGTGEKAEAFMGDLWEEAGRKEAFAMIFGSLPLEVEEEGEEESWAELEKI
ncbi:hypothetical protein GUITHDRAFT_115937 [Guillardia theta CCMP2712]|uniref:RWP-RK domain-containing protein n=1 Tax=Guillardia theta (strain CCMP2712) TaxID=905079 RepID=L1INV2_GUITC|nr:hypothetical protein GUITHDRAFT_115937 [Guillardia theta CCMP2712]EKX37966.1 hypothetical protein GUITHDRAFT_115937 [Guillardia theta CCMP2712]|eukprot:XP_005824946.1 hypothetical protein GUITHDRAFT_115937 [Guillardia theta CCMP2712]